MKYQLDSVPGVHFGSFGSCKCNKGVNPRDTYERFVIKDGRKFVENGPHFHLPEISTTKQIDGTVNELIQHGRRIMAVDITSTLNIRADNVGSISTSLSTT